MPSKEIKMMMSFGDEEAMAISARFSDDDLLILNQYCDNSVRLRETRIVKEGLPSNLEIKWSDDGTKVNADLDFETVGSFLHYLRPLFLQKERASFKKTADLIEVRFSHESMNRHLEAIRAVVDNSPFSAYGQITIAGVPMFDNKTLTKWINAFHYHQDESKRSYLKDVTGSLGTSGTEAIFVQELRQRTEGYFHLESLARFIIEL